MKINMGNVFKTKPSYKSVDHDLKIISKIRKIIFLECLLGVNRTYLYRYSKVTVILISVYCFFFAFGTILIDFFSYNRSKDTIGILHIVIFHLEYFFFYLSAFTAGTKKLKKLFQKLSQFDEILKIEDDLERTSSMGPICVWFWLCLFCNGFQFYLHYSKEYFGELSVSDALLVMHVLIHDLEQLLWVSLFRSVWGRLRALRARAAALRPARRGPPRAGPARLGPAVDSLHAAYQLLHKCCDYLNYIISVPMLMTMATSGYSTIALIYSIYRVENMSNILLYFCLLRIFTFLSFISILCYYSSLTASEASDIRCTVYKKLEDLQLGTDSTEHHKLKVFFYLTRESCFHYALYGVIKLDLTLPPTFAFLCVTYMIIVVQFTKFIDVSV